MNKTQLIRYSLGFVTSLLLTVVAYLLVTQTNVSVSMLLLAISVLAVIQLLVQLVCFLHLGDEAKPRWRTWTFVAMTGSLLLIVFGSIWIMKNLDYHMMPEHDINSRMIKESNKGF